MTNPVPLPPPYLGEFDKLPVAAMQHPYAEISTNYDLDDGVAKLRTGDSRFCEITPVGTAYCAALTSYGVNSKLFAFVANITSVDLEVYDISSGTATLVDLIAAGADINIATVIFKDYLFVCTSSAGLLRQYTGAAWSAPTFTFPGSFLAFGGNVYKRRVYFIGYNSSTYGYGGSSLIGGAVTEVPMADQVSQSAKLYAIKSVTLSEGLSSEVIQCFIFSSGEVLAYRGLWPNAPDWSLVGRFLIPKPIWYNAAVDANGDSYIITEGGIYSLRSLFRAGYGTGQRVDDDIAITDPITNRWAQVVRALYPSGFGTPVCLRGVYDQARDRLVINLIYNVTRSTGAIDTTVGLRLIYSFVNKAWTEHTVGHAQSGYYVPIAMEYYKDDTFYSITSGGKTVVLKLSGASDYQDDDRAGQSRINYAYQLRTAPLPTSKFGVSKMAGVELIMKSDLYDQTNFTLIGDLGVVTTADQTTSGNGTALSKTFVNAGIEAGYCQLDISGTTTSGKSVGQEIHALNLWSEQGGLR